MNITEALLAVKEGKICFRKDSVGNVYHLDKKVKTFTYCDVMANNWEIDIRPIELSFDNWSHIVNNLPAKYYVNNPSAWEDGFSQQGSDLIEAALSELSIALFNKDVIKVYK